MVRVTFILINIYRRNPKFLQKFVVLLLQNLEQWQWAINHVITVHFALWALPLQYFLLLLQPAWSASVGVCTQGLCQSHGHTRLGPRLMWSPSLLWKLPECSYLDHFHYYLLTKAVIPNKICYESLTRYVVLIFVLQLQEKTTVSRMHTRHSLCPWWTLSIQGAHGLHHFLAVFYDSSLSSLSSISHKER